MSTNTYIQDNIIRRQIYLGRYAGGISKELRKLIVDLGKDIEQMILADQKPDEVLSVIKLRGIQGQIRQAVDDMDISSVVGESMVALSAVELSYMENLLDVSTSADIILTSPEGLYPLILDKKLVLRSTTGVVTRATVAELIDNFTSGIPTGINRRIQIGYKDGESVKEIATAVNRLVSRRKANQAESLVRTIVNHTSTQARLPALIANKDILEGERFVATLDRHTTFICIKYDTENNIYQVGFGPMPPLHYNCRSIRVPVVRAEFGLSGLVGARPERGAKGPGTVRGDTRYAGWLRRQPASFQDDVLGPARGKMFRSGEFKVENFVDASGKVFTLDELKQAA
jgi:hypothetical protein